MTAHPFSDFFLFFCRERLTKLEIDFAKDNIAGFWQGWYDNFFNIDTATEFGLRLWGKILGVAWVNYTENGVTQPVSLDMYRRMVKGKFFAYGCSGTTPEIDRYLQIVFPGRRVYVRDNFDMSVAIVAFEAFTAEESAVLLSDDFLPLPMGVKSNTAIIDPEKILGFDGSELQDFDNGLFLEFH